MAALPVPPVPPVPLVLLALRAPQVLPEKPAPRDLLAVVC
jgi:hypothetical protein